MAFSRYSTDGTEAAEDRPGKRFSRQEYLLGSEQLDLPEWLGVPLRQIPPEYEYTHANFNISAFPHSCMWYYNYWIVRERPGLRNLTLKEFSDQIDLDRERMPKVRKYLIERRRRPALAAARLRLEKLVALPDGGVAKAEAEAEAGNCGAARAVEQNGNAADAYPTSADWCI
jgi:hypothetical protein